MLHNKFTRIFIILSIIFLFAGFIFSVQAEDKLTLSEAIKTGIKNNTTLKNSRHNLKKARYDLKRAKDVCKPDLKFNGSYTRLEEEPVILTGKGSKNQYSIGLSLEQPIYKDLVSEISLAEKNIKLKELQYKQKERQITYQIIEAYYNILKAINTVEIQQEALKIAREHERIARARFKAGTVLKTDILKSTIEKQEVQRKLNSARNQLDIARKNLAVLIGRDQENEFLAVEPVFKPQTSLKLDNLYQLAFTNRVELEINKVNQKLIEYNKEIDDSLYEPTFNVSGNYNNEGSEIDFGEGSWSLTASVSVDLYDGGLDEDQKKKYDQDLEKLKNSLTNLKETIKVDVRSVLNNIEELKESIRLQNLSLENARESLRIANRSYKAGTGTNLNVIDAQTSYRQTQINLSAAKYNYKVNLFKMLYKTGKLDDYYKDVISNE